MNSEAAPVLVSCDNGILTIAFNRPDKKNALTHAMYEIMVDALRAADANPEVRVLCFKGNQSCYTSGNDLKDFIGNPPSDENSPVLQFIHALIDLQKPLVAAVRGPAIGIGATMLLHCDLVFADSSATFQMPFTKLALCPEAASSYLLPRVTGLSRAMMLLLLSQTIDAAKAEQWGLVTELLPEAQFEALLQKRLEALCALPPEAVRAGKALVRGPLREAAHAAVGREAAVFGQRLSSAEAAEAMMAFLERRPPDFSRFS